jgi:hypothetical protein
MSASADPAHGAVAVVLDQDVTAKNARGLYVGVAGNLSVVMSDGSAVTFTAVPAGTVLPIRVKQVTSSGTVASGLLLLI